MFKIRQVQTLCILCKLLEISELVISLKNTNTRFLAPFVENVDQFCGSALVLLKDIAE